MKKILYLKIMAVLVAVLLLQTATPISNSQAAPEAQYGYGSGQYYMVQRGDTLFQVGRIFGMNPYYIAEVNGIYNPNLIYAGQWLYIPQGGGYEYGYTPSSYGYGYECGYSYGNCGGNGYYGNYVGYPYYY